MSGIAGILHLDRAPVDRSLISAMADALAFRGPDAQNIWTDGPVGFAHTLLATTFESAGERQPATLDGQVWITADARIDARQDLARELGLPQSALCRPDCELILHAYARWGESCVEHLLGDFAFAIWDGRARKLFCARDHLGQKPLYYAQIGSAFLFSNTLNCLRLHPGISDRLDDAAIGDFLMFGCKTDLSATAFSDIRRLPPAHSLTCNNASIDLRRYWSLELPDIVDRKPADCIGQFRELLTAAVHDRIRSDRVSISMSGGLDSTTVAAIARQGRARDAVYLRAFSCRYERIAADPDPPFTEAVAQALQIPLTFYALDDYPAYHKWHEFPHPEPEEDELCGVTFGFYATVAAHSRVALSGDGGDPLCRHSGFYVRQLMQSGRLLTVGQSILQLFSLTHRAPYIGLRTALCKPLLPAVPSFPDWLNVDFVSRVNLRDRWQSYHSNRRIHAPHGEIEFCLKSPLWCQSFEAQDSGSTDIPLEIWNPLFDFRVLKYILTVPPVPWCVDKYLIRRAAEGLLPDAVRLRPKSRAASPYLCRARSFAACWRELRSDPETTVRMREYLSIGAIASELSAEREQWSQVRPWNLGLWLRHRH